MFSPGIFGTFGYADGFSTLLPPKMNFDALPVRAALFEDGESYSRCSGTSRAPRIPRPPAARGHRTGRLACWPALVHPLDLKAPVSDPNCISHRHLGGSQRREGPWPIFDKRYHAGNDLAFALRHESIDLLILKRTLESGSPKATEKIVQDAPDNRPDLS